MQCVAVLSVQFFLLLIGLTATGEVNSHATVIVLLEGVI